MIQKPNVKSDAEFNDWVSTWPVGESVSARYYDSENVDNNERMAGPDAIHLRFERHFKESEFPHNAWSDVADDIYFALKRLDYFDVYWRIGPEVTQYKSFVDGSTKFGSFVRLTVVPREKPSVGDFMDMRALTDGFKHLSGGITLASNSEYEYLNVPQTFTGIPKLPEMYSWSHNTTTGVVTEPQKIEWSHVSDENSFAIGVDPAVTYPEKFYWMEPNGLQVSGGGYVAEPLMPLPYKEIGSGMMDFMSAVDAIRDSLSIWSYPGCLKAEATTAPVSPPSLAQQQDGDELAEALEKDFNYYLTGRQPLLAEAVIRRSLSSPDNQPPNSALYTQQYVDQAERIHTKMMNELRASMGIEPLPEKFDGK